MIDLQELITRGKFIFNNATGRLDVFKLVNGKNNIPEIAKELNRHPNSIRRDLNTIRDAGLIQPKTKNGEEVKKDSFPVYEKIPLARTVSLKYFQGPTRITKVRKEDISGTKSTRISKRDPLSVPTEQEILKIANHGEDQTIEFKSQGTAPNKITREIGAMLNTEKGGIIFYGIDNDGTICGTDVSRQDFDQPLQNAVKNNISPAAVIQLYSVNVIGSDVLVIIVPPWNRKDVYQHNEKILLRKGTNAFGAKPEEVKALHDGKIVI